MFAGKIYPWPYSFPVIYKASSLRILSGVLLSTLMMLLSTLNVIVRLICDNTLLCLSKVNLTFETLWSRVGRGL